jgi:hypothetical protein
VPRRRRSESAGRTARVIRYNKQDATDVAASARPAQHAMRNTQRKPCTAARTVFATSCGCGEKCTWPRQAMH